MEQLSLLQKIYLYGETLSSEELNQIVLYLNSSIEAINTLIARNNNINEGHCEMRYKVSAQLPEAPESGTDGKSNGWSDTYTRPDTANGEITWMTLSFFNGEGVYGAWSTPVCITWGSIRGQVGPKGESGLKGSFKSRVFKRLNSRPDTPTGGTYDSPLPTSGGWTDGIPSGAAIIWSSVCTFYGNGLSSGWSIPAPESDSDTLDIEFSPYTLQPEPPTGDTPFSNHESEGWYDPSSNNFNSVGTMIWRAERKVSNGDYNGDWTITRIVGEKGARGDSGLTGGHYEFRYNNFKPSEQASAPTKPSNGSNGTTGGWTTSQETLTETLIKEGYATWMTQCYQNEASTYDVWTDPIRITGANGYDGADGVDIEFVYTRRTNLWDNPTPPPTTQIDDWPTNGNSHLATVNGVTWYDNPLGVTDVLMYEYVSLRQKINDVWSDYSTPVVWSKWGEKGMDGDGFEYIYKRFQTVQNWTNITGDNNPANWKTNHPTEFLNTREYLGPTNETKWNDDPQGIDETHKYEYVSVRLEIDGVWNEYSTPTLWSGLPGVFLSRVFTRTNDDISNVTPSGGTYTDPKPNNTVVGSGQNQKTYVWSDSIPNGEAIIWSSTCIFNGDGSNNGWSKPLKESDTANLDIEFTDANSANGSTAPTAPYGNTPFSNHSSENPAWYDPSNIPANKTMVWRAERKVTNGVYDGDWVITRIKGEKGDPGTNGGNYEFRYKNATSATAPTTGTSGTTDGWNTTLTSPSESDLKSGIYTWMTYCYKSYAGTYGTWSTPIRITGANGYDGADGSDVEFIYTRNNDGNTPTAPTASGSGNTKVFSADDWYGLDNNEVTWTDNPVGVESTMKYEYVAVREKPAGKNQSWGAYHVALWSKWGEKGMDGDGFEYIYKNFGSIPTWGENNNNPAYWNASDSDEYTGPDNSGWTDNPQGVDSSNKYEYVSVRRRKSGETWGKFSTPTMWAKFAIDGINGNHIEFRYKNAATQPDTPSSSNPSGWSALASTPSSGEYTWMSQSTVNGAGTYGAWSTPIRITGDKGENGADGSDIEFIYTRNDTGNTPDTPTSVNTDDYIPSNWTDNPQGVESSMRYEFVSTREKAKGASTWGNFSTPVVWSKYGEKGQDGDGYEYIYKHFISEQTWAANDNNNPANWAASTSSEYYGPLGFEWSDDPTGVDSTNKFEYVSVRRYKLWPNETVKRWGTYETPKLWSNYAEAQAAVPGPKGDIGPMSYLAGIWNATTTYTKTAQANPIVYYTPNDSYYYLVGTPPVSSYGENPTTSDKWAQAENYNMVFTDILFANTFAKLGSFIVNRDWMLCHYGTIYDYGSGIHPILNKTDSISTDATHTYNYLNAYVLFDPAYPDRRKPNEWNFVPNYAINAVTGEIFCNNAHITGEVTANSGTFNGTVNASGGVFNGIVNATLFKAGDDSGFSITTSPDSLDFNYNGNRLAFFSLRSWDATNNQLADVSDNPTGFYLYMTNPLNGHLITINFNSLSFKDLNENLVLRHEATFYRLSNLNGKAVETPVKLYYSLENNTTKWWLHSDSATELTSSEMGTLYKKQQVNQRGVGYPACVQEVDVGTPHASTGEVTADTPYVTTNYTLYELQTLQNNAPTKTGNYAMATHLNTNGSSSTDYWFVVPNSTTLLDSLNTNWGAVFLLNDGTVNSTTATTVIRSSNHNTVPTFNSAVSFISRIEKNGNVTSILYPTPTLNF